MTTHNKLYREHANLYSLIADDRDFSAEVRRMGVFEFGEGARFVELFAGPAYHSRALVNQGWKGEVYAVDVSDEMASVAQDAGYDRRYVCADAIEGLAQINSADVVCIPRFSIVLVDPDYVQRLFQAIRGVMRQGSRLFVEVHPETTREAGWRSLAIHERRVRKGPVEVVCEWPHDIREVKGVVGAVDMTVRVAVSHDSGTSEEHFFVSREHLHAKDDLIRWATECAMTRDPARSFSTASGEFLAFAPARAPGQTSNLTNDLVDAAFTARFNLSTEEAREHAISLSGLDIARHDSPLSRHVYNLL